MNIFAAWGKDLMLSLVEMEPRAVVEEHDHPHEQMGLMLEGEMTFIIGDETKVSCAPATCGASPAASATKSSPATTPVRALDVFHPIREEYT